MSAYLLPNIKRAYKENLVKIWFVDSEFSIEQEQMIYKHLDKRGEMTMISGSVFSEQIIFINVSIDEEDRSRGCLTYEEILKRVQDILRPIVKSTDLTPVSKYPVKRKVFQIMYGPDLKRIPTTLSHEIKDLLKPIGANTLLRVEIGHCFTFSCKQEISELISDMAHDQLVSRSQITYGKDLNGIHINYMMLHHGSDVTSSPEQEDNICFYVMKKPYGANMPLAQQVAHLPNISIPSTSVATSLSFKTRGALYESKEMTSFHYAIFNHISNLGFVTQQLNTQRMQKSIFLENSCLASSLGCYASSEFFNDGLPYEGLKELHSYLITQADVATRTGSPTLTGFLRLMSPKVLNGVTLYRPMIYDAHLASAIGTNLNNATYHPRQLLVALGTFIPAVEEDTYPFFYRDSVAEYNKIGQTLNNFFSALVSPCVSSTLRDIGKRTVKEHIFALLKQGGVNIFLSRLPADLLYQLKTIDPEQWTISIEYLLAVYFFDVYSNLVFFILDNKKVYTTLGQQYLPIEILQRSAQLFNCEVHIFGETTADAGIHIYEDLQSPYDFKLKKQPERTKLYSMFKLKQNEHGKPHPTRGNANQSSQPESVQWADSFNVSEAIKQILLNPAVGSKEFLVRHMDRCSNGLVAQQPGVGPLDLPLADYGLVLHSAVKPPMPCDPEDGGNVWETMTFEDLLNIHNPEVHESLPATCLGVGEQPLKIALSPINGARLAMTEVITNMMLGPRMALTNMIMTASVVWDPSSNLDELRDVLFACQAFARDLKINFVISSASSSQPGDSRFLEAQPAKFLKNIVFTGSCKVNSVKGVVPVLQAPGNILVHIPVSYNLFFGGTVFESIYNMRIAEEVPSVSAAKLLSLFNVVQEAIESGIILSGHDVSDGGLVAAAIEMCLSTDFDVEIHLPEHQSPLPVLLAETPGVLVEVTPENFSLLKKQCDALNIACFDIGKIKETEGGKLFIYQGASLLYENKIELLRDFWTSFSNNIMSDFFDFINLNILDISNYGSNELDMGNLTEKLMSHHIAFYYNPDIRHKVAVLTWPGMVKECSLFWAFTNANFDVYTVSINEISDSSFFDSFRGLAIQSNTGHIEPMLASMGAVMSLQDTSAHTNSFALAALLKFFKRADTFSLCCGEFGFMIMSQFLHYFLNSDASQQHDFVDFTLSPISLEKNVSGVYESRWLNVRVSDTSPSIMLEPCKGMLLPCWVQGTYLGLKYTADQIEHQLFQKNIVACSYHQNSRLPDDYAQHYPRNPTGNSIIAGLCSLNGRHLALTFDPSLVFFPWQWQHIPAKYKGLQTSPWSLMFYRMHMWCYSH